MYIDLQKFVKGVCNLIIIFLLQYLSSEAQIEKKEFAIIKMYFCGFHSILCKA